MVRLYEHQREALEKLKTGSILCGGVGSGKTLTSLAYYYVKECGGKIDDVDGLAEIEKPKDLYVVTTAAKRDTLDWESEAAMFAVSRDRNASLKGVQLTVDSWNNISKYTNIIGAFFIFDEQRVVGSGAWVRSFLKITKNNNWILLSATPGDSWMDYIPVFVANGFYKNRTDFIRRHVVYKPYLRYPIVDHYVEEGWLQKLKQYITVDMPYQKPTTRKDTVVMVGYDKAKHDIVYKKRWNPLTNLPIKDISEYCSVLRKIVNSDPSRLLALKELMQKHSKIIVFYNFNYELDILRTLKDNGVVVAEHNGHKHEPIPKSESWVYLVQYTSGAEGWNCIETNAIVFYSQNYSYRVMVQAAGRIDRLNTPFAELYYYHIRSVAPIDLAIMKALKSKEIFNEKTFAQKTGTIIEGE